MSPERWLFWHRRDLRLADNLGLAAAAAATPALTGVVVLDPAELNAPTMAPARRWFWRESLRELGERWQAAGSRLLLLEGDPVELLPQLAAAAGAGVVAWNRDGEPLGRERDRQVAAALQAAGRKVLVDWDQLLIAPEQLRTGGGDPYRVYGPFLRNWRGQVERKALLGSAASGGLEPVAAPSGLLDLYPEHLSDAQRQSWDRLPLRQLDTAPSSAPAGPAKRPPWPSCRPSAMAAAAVMARSAPTNRPATSPAKPAPRPFRPPWPWAPSARARPGPRPSRPGGWPAAKRP